MARIIAERADGSTMTAIAERFTAERVPNAHGGARWWPSTVRAVLAAPAR